MKKFWKSRLGGVVADQGRLPRPDGGTLSDAAPEHPPIASALEGQGAGAAPVRSQKIIHIDNDTFYSVGPTYRAIAACSSSPAFSRMKITAGAMQDR